MRHNTKLSIFEPNKYISMGNKNYTVYIEESVFSEMQQNAKRDKRSQSHYIEILIENDNELQRKKRKQNREPKHSND